MTPIKNIFFFILCLLVIPAISAVFFLPTAATAKQAQLLLYPTRIVLDNNERTAALTLKNTGDASGTYRAELIEMNMSENSIDEIPEGQPAPYSAKKLLRISPRSITLAPGEEQDIRLLIRKPANTEDGEYRSHLKITMTESNVEEAAAREANPTVTKGVTIAVRPRLSLVIPVIIRYGKTSYTIKIISAKLHYDKDETGKKHPSVDVVLLRDGNRSSMGDLDITYINEAGKQTLVKHMAGIPVYRPTDRRNVSIPLDVPNGTTIQKGSLHVVYRAQEKEGSGIIAENNFPL